MKKFITLMLALVMVFAMAVPAFADDFVPSVGGDSEESEHEHRWSDWEEVEGGRKRTCEDCGVTVVEYSDGTGEENPDTGSSVVLCGAALVAAAAAVSFKRKK